MDGQMLTDMIRYLTSFDVSCITIIIFFKYATRCVFDFTIFCAPWKLVVFPTTFQNLNMFTENIHQTRMFNYRFLNRVVKTLNCLQKK